MEFVNQVTIKDSNKFINLGKINNELALIFSKIKITKFKIADSDLLSTEENNYIVKFGEEEVNLIYPCDHESNKNINSKSEYEILRETALDYKNIILPYIKNIYYNNVKWINDIIYHDREKEKIFYRNKEFLVIQNISWTNLDKSSTKNSFYLLVIPEEKLMTIRDLRKKHINLLKSMRDKAIEVAKSFDINQNQLYFFFHYHPSFYHLHLHCCIINNPELTTKYFRCKMLETIISNLERNNYFYRNADILFEIPKSHAISKLLSK